MPSIHFNTKPRSAFGEINWLLRFCRLNERLYRTYNDDQITIVDLIGVAVQNLMISRTVYANFIKTKKHA